MRGVKIGSNVAIGTSVLIETAYPQLVSIGNNVSISMRSVIVAHFRESTDKAKAAGEASVQIEDNVYIGAGAIILPNLTIGQGAVVTAGSVVSQSVPPLTMVQGNPAKPVARCGVPLAGNTYEDFVRNLRPIAS
jgi:acetyltransferase-like isoleucine patch superfamily enzyme